MKKKYVYVILLIVILFLVFCFHVEVVKEDKKVTNIGDTLALRIMNLYEIVESGNGLYKINDKYVFRGNSNNYIEFNDELWRIVSLENDGTIKIVRNDLLEYEKEYDETINYLNSDYFNSLKNKDYIVKSKFDSTYYDISKLISFESLNGLVELESKEYNVGMLSVVEIANATTYVTLDQYLNIFFWVNRKSNYLYSSQKWLTMTPSVYVNYDFLKENKNEKAMIRPSVYLKKDLKISSGNGMKSDPYVLKLLN